MGRSYRDRDYGFGQIMLNLRSAIGLTQTGLAEYLGISRFAIGEWEAGNTYPKIDHLKAFIELCIQQDAFPADRETDEVRTLWKASHQKVLLDETWLAALLKRSVGGRAAGTGQGVLLLDGTRVDWGDALALPHFYGREWEITLLTTWVVEQRCRAVSVLGLGGIGKSALAVRLMRQVATQFEVVIWRSVRDAPSCEALIKSLLQVLAPAALAETSVSLEQQFSLLLDALRSQRVLVVLDNLETILGQGENTGQMRPGYEDYRHLLSQVAETEHQSCLLLTSREKLNDVVALEGIESPVRSLRLTQLDANSCQQLLAEKGVVGAEADQARLIEVYTGNPLALKIVAQTLVDLFDGEIGLFLEEGELIFGGVRELLRQQFNRLSAIEQRVLLWLAVLREPTTLKEVSVLLVNPLPRARLLEAMEALHRRSLVERGQKPGSFTLQSVVLEFVIGQLVEQVSGEIERGDFVSLVEQGLVLAQVSEDVRQTQERLILMPVLAHLRANLPPSIDLETLLINRLNALRSEAEAAQGYAPSNLIVLLRVLRDHLRGLDLSHLVLRSMYLQNVEMHDTVLREALVRDCVFTETFNGIYSLSISSTGAYWGATTTEGKVSVWESGGRTLHPMTPANAQVTWALAFSPGEQLLALGNREGIIQLWSVPDGTLIWTSAHEDNWFEILRLAFSPDGSLLAATCMDGGVRLWEMGKGRLLETLTHEVAAPGITWHPDGTVFATSDVTGTIRFWSIHRDFPSVMTMTIQAHEQPVTGLAFSPDGSGLASASWDGTVKLWETTSGSLQETLTGHRERVQRVVWSADGQLIASSGGKGSLWLWEVEARRYRASLPGHMEGIHALAFTPDSRRLVSGSFDGSLRIWDTTTGRCIGIIHGYQAMLTEISWSPDSLHLVGGGSEPLLTVFELNENMLPQTLRGQQGGVSAVSWSPDGRFIASVDIHLIRLWDANTGESLEALHFPGAEGSYLHDIAWHPHGRYLVAGSPTHGALRFDLATHAVDVFGEGAPDWIGHIAWSPNGEMVAGGDDEGAVYVWKAESGELLMKIAGRQGHSTCVVWSADSTRVAIGLMRGSTGDLLIWDVTRGERSAPSIAHPSSVISVAWAGNDQLLITGDHEGVLRWWDTQTGACIFQEQAHQGSVSLIETSPDGTMVASCGHDGAIGVRDALTGEMLKTLRRDRPYERMDISGVRGLNEAQKATLRALGAVEVVTSP